MHVKRAKCELKRIRFNQKSINFDSLDLDLSLSMSMSLCLCINMCAFVTFNEKNKKIWKSEWDAR